LLHSCTILSSACAARLLRERPAQDTQPVASEDRRDVLLRVAEFGERLAELLQVSNRVDARRGVLHAKAAVEVGADTDVVDAARHLADVVDGRGDGVQRDGLLAIPALPARLEE